MPRGGGEEEAAEGGDEGEVDFGGEIPEGGEVVGAGAVDEVHGGDETRFGGLAADVVEVVVGVGGGGLVEGADDVAVHGYFGGEVGEVEVAC